MPSFRVPSVLGTLTLGLLLVVAPPLRAQSDPPLKFKDGPEGMQANLMGNAPGGKITAASLAETSGIADRRWLKIDAAYTVNAPLEYLPTVRFKVYVDVDSPKGKLSENATTPAVLYGEATYLNVPNAVTGHELHVSFYLHPYTLHRFGGERNFDHFGADRNIHIDAYVGEDKVASRNLYDVPPENAKWYLADGLQKISGLVIPKEQSPYAREELSTYPQAPLKTTGTGE